MALMVLGSASFADLARALAGAQTTLRRDVNPTVMTRREFAARLATGDGFARSAARGDKPLDSLSEVLCGIMGR